MKVLAIDQRNLNRISGHRACRQQSPKAASNNHHPRFGFRIHTYKIPPGPPESRKYKLRTGNYLLTTGFFIPPHAQSSSRNKRQTKPQSPQTMSSRKRSAKLAPPTPPAPQPPRETVRPRPSS